MAGLTRYPFAGSATAVFSPSAPTVFAPFLPDQTVAFSTSVTKSFRPNRQTRVYFTVGLPAGLLVSSIVILGNAQNYFAVYTIYNGTSSTITPASQQVILYQDT